MKTVSGKNESVDMGEMLSLQEELAATKRAYGIKEEEGRISRWISNYFEKKENREELLLDRKTYLLLAVFTGWIGGHRFFARQYKTAVLYVLFFWTGFPMAMTLIDLLVAIPKQTDKNGKIKI